MRGLSGSMAVYLMACWMGAVADEPKESELRGPLQDAGVLALVGEAPAPESGLSLWYRKPALKWEEALPLGNGRLGAMVFGGVVHERIQLNEETVWDGVPGVTTNPDALKALPEVRRLLFEGRNQEATDLADRTMMGRPKDER